MGPLLRTLGEADRLAALWRQGLAAAIVIEDRLLAKGFYAVSFEDRKITAYLNGVRFELPGDLPIINERKAA